MIIMGNGISFGGRVDSFFVFLGLVVGGNGY